MREHPHLFSKARKSGRTVSFEETDNLAASRFLGDGGNKDVDKIYARRIVATFNALAGVSTEWLEAFPLTSKQVVEWAIAIEQRDFLLEAVKAYFNDYMQDEAEDAECCSEHQHRLAKAVQEAIAKVESK